MQTIIYRNGSHYQTYNFQVVCKDNNQPKQLINKTITILIADELKSYTVTLGAQANTEHGHFLKFSTGEVFTLEQARQMSMEELQEIELCYFYGEDDEVTSYYREQRLYPLLGTHNSSVSWGYLSNEFAALTPYKINTLDEAITAGGYAQNKFGFIQATITASPKYIEDYKYSTDLKRGVSLTEATHPTLEGIYIITLQKLPSGLIGIFIIPILQYSGKGISSRKSWLHHVRSESLPRISLLILI